LVTCLLTFCQTAVIFTLLGRPTIGLMSYRCPFLTLGLSSPRRTIGAQSKHYHSWIL